MVMVTHHVVLLYLLLHLYACSTQRTLGKARGALSRGIFGGSADIAVGQVLDTPLPAPSCPPDSCHRMGRGLRAEVRWPPRRQALHRLPSSGVGSRQRRHEASGQPLEWLSPPDPHPAGCKQRAEEGKVKQPHL